MDNLENVEDLTSLWNFDESYQLRNQLHYVTMELAEARKEASAQGKMYKETVKKLIYLLGIAYKERDETKAQLRKLLMVKPPPPPTPTTTMTTTHPTVSPRSLLMMMKNNSINDLPPIIIPNSGMTSHWNTPSTSLDSYFDVGSSSSDTYNMLSSPNYDRSSYDTTCTLLDMYPPQDMHAPQIPPVPNSLYKRARYKQ